MGKKNFSKKRTNNKGKSNHKPAPRESRDESVKKRDFYRDGGGGTNYDNITTNDISWWNKMSTNFKMTTRIPYGYVASYPYDNAIYGNIVDSDDSIYAHRYAIPTAMRITYTPGVGLASSNEDGCNVAFTNMYAAIASKSSSAVPFPKHMLATHIIALQSIAQNLALCKRALSVSNMWHAANVAFPKMMLRIMGIEPDSVIEHRDDVAVALNNAIRRFNSYPVPSYIDVFARHYSLAHNVWADQNDVRAQFYIFMPSVWYYYSDLGNLDPSTGELDGVNTAIAVKFPWADGNNNSLADINDIFDIISMQLDAISNSSDFGNIQGWLLRTFDAGSFLRIDEVDENYVNQIAVDDIMLNQIHNLVAVGNMPNMSFSGGVTSSLPLPYRHFANNIVIDGSITGDPVTNVIHYRPKTYAKGLSRDSDPIAVGDLGYNGNYLLNVYDPKYVESNEAAMEFTRLMSMWSVDPHDRTYKYAEALGTEFINHIIVFNNVWNEATQSIETTWERLPLILVDKVVAGTKESSNYDTYTITTALSKFHLSPRIPTGRQWFETAGDAHFEFRFTGVTGDLMYWTTVDAKALRNMHFNAIQSVFSATLPVHVK